MRYTVARDTKAAANMTELLHRFPFQCWPHTAVHLSGCRSLLELNLDGNPVAGQNGIGSRYRRYVLQRLPKLHHLDLKRVTGQEQLPPHAHHNPGTFRAQLLQ